ncbi:Uma2 family endonuclease [Catenuloplanes japonicus]|uniref:Uma2 family endonuclease n=1 Tax=Catenuloplanes japonicus TaxID=33876 RepID=UPI0005278DE4|nr:Uma2 family endonuclease [Catenuloplanes japonicus]
MTLAPILPERDEWTVDDLAQLPPDLRYELINGRLIILSSPTFVHQKICVETYRALEQNCPPDRHPALDLSLKVDSRNEPRPDILVVDPARGWRSPLPIEDALVVVEVVSPSSATRDQRDKVKLYARAGVRAYWVIRRDRDRLILTERTLVGDIHRITTETDGVFVTDVPWKVTLDLPALMDRCIELSGLPED